MSTLADWRTLRRTTLALPSGLVVEVKRASLIDLAARGSIPATLHGHVSALIAAQTSGGVSPALDVASFPTHAAMIDIIATAALVSPAVAEVADETHITIDELPFEDRVAIFNWAQGGATALVPFSGEPPRAGEGAAPAGDHLRAASKRHLARAGG